MKADIIARIRELYPPDSDFAFDGKNPTHPGPDLLWQAICKRWDHLPVEILETLYKYNRREERRQQRRERNA